MAGKEAFDSMMLEDPQTPYYVGWGTLALLNAGLAQSQNRSGFGWFVGSLFVGPIVTLILVAFCEKLPEDPG